jgi:tetratricopeptide (TPR) repeat protein
MRHARPEPNEESIAAAIEPVFRLILDLPARPPVAGLPRRLGALFRDLKTARPDRAEEIEDLIWALWISHEDRKAEEIMGAAVDALASSDLPQARFLLDHLVERHPEWPEAWNKRATLSFIEKRDAECLADIRRTLDLEPRHFGAISGFGQICLRQRHLNEARAAFQVALSLNPHLEGLREIIRDLNPRHLMLH